MFSGKLVMKNSINRLSFFLLAYFFHPCSFTSDTITPSQYIRDGETIVSAGGIFELGFFSPPGSKNRYVGIWYHDIQPQTVVWVANRNNPITDTAGFLTIIKDDKLVVFDGRQNTIWSRGNFKATNFTATLEDSGNFILKGWGSTKQDNLWTSFTNPTDTLLQGKRMQENRVRSWKNSSDPSIGSFIFQADFSQPQLQLKIMRGSDLYWSSGSWNGSIFEEIPEVNENFFFHFSLDDIGFKYSSMYKRTRMVMDTNGQLKFFIWNESDAQWKSVWWTRKNDSATIPSRSKHSSNRKLFPMIISLTTVIGIFILGTFICFWRRRYSRKGFRRAIEILNRHNYTRNREEDLDLPFFDFQSIANATNNFSHSNQLGQGGFGHVYKGTLPGGQEIAVKRLSSSSTQGLEEFKNEIILIAKLQHRNLVRLIGYCIQGDEKMLLYEYMPNKSLDHFLFDQSRRSLLDWKRRFTIILGIAKGLLYLHQDSILRIIHRDLKASNILLDEEMNPKISDFGLARMFEGNQTRAITNRVAGTYGYMSPEYVLDGLFSEKSDVFSFGVLLLEIISGKKNTGFYHPDNSLSLLGYAWRLWREEKGVELIDPLLNETSNIQDVLNCIHLGLLCVQEDATDRPTMATVVVRLASETANLPLPKQPSFYIKKNLSTVGSSSSGIEFFSKNEITITNLEGR